MLPSIRKTAIAAVAALATLAAPVTPASAWGKNEQNFLKGVLATVAVGTIINQVQKQRVAPPVARQPVYQPVYRQPVYRQPDYRQPDYRQPIYAPAPQYVSVYSTPAARAFMAYSMAERRAIQRRLAAYGYYFGGIDGAFGPGTYAAITGYARDQGQDQRLASIDSAFGVYDALIY